jgi:hypothetical protein
MAPSTRMVRLPRLSEIETSKPPREAHQRRHSQWPRSGGGLKSPLAESYPHSSISSLRPPSEHAYVPPPGYAPLGSNTSTGCIVLCTTIVQWRSDSGGPKISHCSSFHLPSFITFPPPGTASEPPCVCSIIQVRGSWNAVVTWCPGALGPPVARLSGASAVLTSNVIEYGN